MPNPKVETATDQWAETELGWFVEHGGEICQLDPFGEDGPHPTRAATVCAWPSTYVPRSSACAVGSEFDRGVFLCNSHVETRVRAPQAPSLDVSRLGWSSSHSPKVLRSRSVNPL